MLNRSDLNKDGYTVQDILALPEGERAELIDGVWYNMAAPSSTHQRTAGGLYRKIADFLEKKGGACEAFIAPFAVFLHDDDKTYLEPDISVICDKEKIKEDGCHGAPDWVIEVASESTRQRDYLVKLVHYSNAGVREYWIVDPDHKRITAYHIAEEAMDEYTFEDMIPCGLYEDLIIDFKDISRLIE